MWCHMHHLLTLSTVLLYTSVCLCVYQTLRSCIICTATAAPQMGFSCTCVITLVNGFCIKWVVKLQKLLQHCIFRMYTLLLPEHCTLCVSVMMTIQEKLVELCTKEVMSCWSVLTCSSVPWNHVTFGFMQVLSLMKLVNGRQQTMRMQAQSMNYHPKEK